MPRKEKKAAFSLVVAAIFGRGGWSTAIADRIKSFDNRWICRFSEPRTRKNVEVIFKTPKHVALKCDK